MKKSGQIVASKFILVLMVICSVAVLILSTGLAQNIIEGIRGSSEGVITGIVTDAETDNPIPDALMTLKYHGIVRTELTDSRGKYTFTGVPICYCLKNISASKEGYESQYKLVAVHKITHVDFSLKPIEGGSGSMYGVITGIVTDAETIDPIPNALLTLKYHDVVCTELTDVEGQYTFTDVPICFCLKNVSAYKSGYETQYKMVAVHKITYVNFSLEPINDTQEPENPEEPEEPEEPKNPPEDPDEPDEPPVPPMPPDDDGSMYGVITGVVTDAETNDPITDVLMTLIYHDIVRTELTDSNGWYTFTDAPICFCLKNVSAYKSGYEGQYQLVAVSEMTYVNFSLSPVQSSDSDTNSNTFSREFNDREPLLGSQGLLFRYNSANK